MIFFKATSTQNWLSESNLHFEQLQCTNATAEARTARMVENVDPRLFIKQPDNHNKKYIGNTQQPVKIRTQQHVQDTRRLFMSSEGFTPCQPFRPIGFARTTRRYASS
jgi:hypothetical protein